MQFVNITTRTVYTSFSGTLHPGEVSADGGAKRKRLEEALSDVVKVCGDRLGIRLNAREVQLLNQLMALDERGGGFDVSQLPPEVRDDPTGEKRNAEAIRAAQQHEMDVRGQMNAENAQHEAMINGETARKPVGPATMQGETVNPSDLKSGFEKIMEENARIAAGKKPADIGEILDPIGVHAKKEGVEVVAPADNADKVPGGEPVSVSKAENAEGDGTKSAETAEPVPQAPERGSEMDRQAAEIAAGLATMGPVDAKGKKGKGRKAK